MAAELKEKAIKGVTWNLMERFGMQGLTFILGVILARLLTPEDYGLIGMMVVFFAVADVFVKSGLGQAYVQKKEVTDLDATTIFYTNLIISALLYVVLWFAAPAISRFYEQPALLDLTRVMGVIVIIHAFNVIQQAQVRRDLDFKRKTKITIIATLLSGIAGIGAAIGGLGVWSLVIKNLSNALILTMGLWITSAWKPSLSFSLRSFREMFAFGVWILGSGILRKVFENIYKLVIGKLFPAAQLGFYTQSRNFQRIASEDMAMAVSSVAFPVFSQMQGNKVRMRQAMHRFLTHSMVIIMPLMVTLAVVAEPFVILLLTEKWAPMIPYLQLLCIVGFLYPIQSVNIQMLVAHGKSRLNFNLSLIKNALRILNIVIMYRYGVIYIILGEVAVSVISLAINTYYTKKFIDYGLLRQLKDVGIIAAGSLAAGALAFAFMFLTANHWLMLFGGAALSFALYVGSSISSTGSCSWISFP
ncbi:MAG: lipopolysaccharide biosynthesis protein [Candidatus Marinimicrobia bacterium]|nr:lipopolysaccharide biosynthesis protein [Candidatus Neomarinimicrobiota bacterium]